MHTYLELNQFQDMEPSTQRRFQSEEEDHEKENEDEILLQSGMIIVENNVAPISEEQINGKISKINVEDNPERPKHQPLNTGKQAIIRHQNHKKLQKHKQMKIEYPQNYKEQCYIQSIEEITKILNHQVLNKIKFIQLILRDFSPYVFSKNVQKHQDQKQVDQFDSQASFTSQGQVIEKKQTNSPQKSNPSDDKVLIEKDIFNTQWMEQHWDNKLLRNLIIHNPIFHSRIVCVLYFLTSNKKTHDIQFSQELLELKKKLHANELRYSFDEDLWTQYRQQLSSKYHKDRQTQDDKLIFILQKFQEDNNFKVIDEFYTKLGFRKKSHPFNKKMVILNQLAYRLRYLKEFSFFSFSSAEQVLEYLGIQDSDRFQNIAFYCNEIKVSSRRVKLRLIHDDYCRDYEWLESCHNYIQWLFPNHFKSQFNESSFPLGYIEAEIFKSDPQLRKKLLRSFEIYIDFMGCSIKILDVPLSTSSQKSQNQKRQKKITIIPNNNRESYQRLQDCLIYHTHNHLRIMRILASLSVTGLRKYAEAFLRFFIHLKNFNPNFSSLKYPLEKNWNVYSTYAQNKQKALQMCFIPYQNFSYLQIEDDENKKEEINFLEKDNGKKRVKMQK